jgi:hypothetical protein
MTKKKKSVTFPVKDNLFDAAFKQLMANLAAKDATSSQPTVVTWTRLGMDSNSEYTPLLNLLGNATLQTSWEYVYTQEKAKSLTNEALKLQKDEIKANALIIIRSVRLILKAKAKTTPNFLSPNDKKVWYIPEPDPITPSKDAVLTQNPIPMLSIFETKPLHHTLDAVNPDSPKSKSLPEGMQFIWLKRFIGATPPTDPDLFSHVMFSGKYRNISKFVVANQRQIVWYIACYISTTGVTGDFCLPINANVA